MGKILYVLHSGDIIYGSGRSIVKLAKSINRDCDIIIGKSLLHKINEEEIREAFGAKLDKIYQLWLPNFNFYYGKPKELLLRIAALHKDFMWLLNKKKFEKLLEENHYDIIHLNSMILSPLVNSKYPMILHVREVFEGSVFEKRYIENKMKQSRGVIFINPSTRNRFLHIDINERVIQDPFDMTELNNINSEEIKKQFNIDCKSVIFAIIGRYEDRNGTEFIVDSFRKTLDDKAVLLVVGIIPKEKIEECKKIQNEDSRIRFIGEVKDPNPIFAICDYVLRGERFFSGFSRTVYEGLYAGANVIFPGTKEEAKDAAQYDEFSDRIFFYPPRNAHKLAQLIDECAKAPVKERKFLSNEETYKKDYLELIENIKCVSKR